MTAEIAAANNFPLIRLFTVGQGTQSRTPLSYLNTTEQPWAVASSASVATGGWNAFSAVCWFTYRDMFTALGGTVPFGLISNNWGGTPIEHWSSPDALAVCNAGTDSVLWNAMVNPYTLGGGMKMRTGIWYQGEANIGNAPGYDCKMTEMIRDWRAKLPGLNTFGIVQIAPCACYGVSPASADLRQSQLSPLRSLNNIAYALTTDIVYPWSGPADIHPSYKQAVGARMAAQILTLEYEVEGLAWEFPMYQGASTVTSGTAISVTVNLKGCGEGCTVVDSPTTPPGVNSNQTATWMIQTNDPSSTWWPATAQPTVDGQSLILSVTAPATGFSAIASSYGRNAYPLAAAFGKNGLPVAPWCYTLTGIPCYSVKGEEYTAEEVDAEKVAADMEFFAAH